jgi:hypothetical protein
MKNLPSNFKSLPLVLLLGSALLAGGCAGTASQPEVQETAAPSDEPAWEIPPWDGHGLDFPLDGTSMEAWERSLRTVEAHTEPGEYRMLLGAIDYLRVYDVGARGKMEILITRLNGLTGNQIISRVNWRLPKARTAPGAQAPEGSTAAQPE